MWIDSVGIQKKGVLASKVKPVSKERWAVKTTAGTKEHWAVKNACLTLPRFDRLSGVTNHRINPTIQDLSNSPNRFSSVVNRP